MFNADDQATELLRQAADLEQARSQLDTHLEEIASRVLPSHAGTFLTQGQNVNPGAKKNDLMYDATAALSLTKFAAVLEDLLTPRNSKWHRLVPTDKALLRNRQARDWYEQAADLLFAYRMAPKTNYSDQKQMDYLQVGAFGTSALFIDKLAGGPGLRYKSCHLADIFIRENHQGMVDTVYRRIRWTARQAVQMFGDLLPPEITDAAGKTPDKEYVFWHCVEPRKDFDPQRVDYKGMPWASYYVSVTGKKVLREGGYQTFPYSIGRHVVAPGEVYGRSPAMMVLPNIKVLNEQKKTLLKQGHRAVDPVLLMHDDGILDTFSLKPGAMNAGGVTAAGQPLVHALPVGNLPLMKDLMEDERHIIRDAFYVTLFEILVQDRREMTATEFLGRAREKGILLAPAMGRQQSEALGPQIDREIDLLMQQGLLPPMPQIIKDARGEYKAEYDSPMSRAARAEEAMGFIQWAESLLKIATESQNPAALDWIDIDAAAPELADIRAVPLRWVRTQEAVVAARQGREQQAGVQQLIDAAPAVAGLVKAGAGVGGL